ncbi:hypothetical protein GCM10010466_67800 [Planomonospora alba]|uniref:Transposase IS701-like DDE domain-containing protein n=1 Tax=Planomonospora alba TaxID=161354 RepID=A0ABP6P580_9ACTN
MRTEWEPDELIGSWTLVDGDRELVGNKSGATRFGRVEPRRTATAYVRGLPADLDRKNCWSLAEHAGLPGPQAMQRQYTGTAGKIENSQVGVFLAYATPRGRALIDRRLYLPARTWPADPARRRTAAITDQAVFATRSVLAIQMIGAALAAGADARRVSGDEVYGQAPDLRAFLEEHLLGYVLAIAGNRRVALEGVERTAAQAATLAADGHWHRYSAGPGAKGPRFYLWAWARIDTDDADRAGGCRWLLIRRHPATGELAFYRCYAPAAVPLLTLVRVAGARWAVEESFQAAKGQVGLDHYQVRTSDRPAPAHHAGHARAGVLGRAGRRPAGRRSAARPVDAAGDPSSAGRTRPGPATRGRGGSALATVASPSSGRRPPVPLPAQIPVMISKCHWSISAVGCLREYWADLDAIAAELNDRPRKIHRYRSPA